MAATKEQSVKEKREAFFERVKDLRGRDIEAMKEEADLSPWKWTSTKNGNRDLTRLELAVVARYLGLRELDIIYEYGLGLTSVTAEELTTMARAAGKEIVLVDAAA